MLCVLNNATINCTRGNGYKDPLKQTSDQRLIGTVLHPPEEVCSGEPQLQIPRLYSLRQEGDFLLKYHVRTVPILGRSSMHGMAHQPASLAVDTVR